ncbi:MAG: CDP-alcohol phosphatidyltransferase family protein [Bacteroidaceae bacterium]|nr:CDP-alcohol phosphatidyltransferase family protein [Bacteroidaceae bacterium]
MASFITRQIPNTLTCCNLISGCIATYMAFEGLTEMSLCFIIIGAVFDFFDGFAARLLHVSSPIGKELDSLADDVTFGFAPSAIVFMLLRDLCSSALLPYAAFLMAAFSALRLAKFNLDERQTSSFIGLPTPANALFWGAFTIGFGNLLADYSWASVVILCMLVLSCFLLVAEIPMFALKFKHYGVRENAVRYFFLLTAVLLIVLLRTKGIALAIVWYIVLSLLTQKRQNTKI